INSIDILKKVGGFEIGGIAGAILAASYNKTAVVIDGIISTAGALIAYLLNKNVTDFIFAGHKSVEIGQTAALNLIGIEPILDFKMRLGEGTGASLAINIIEAACKIMTEMASFEDAGVSQESE
ncbi:MAG: nicotinate-nucleotide--dimethylbenzimidazole phosphoribosyltransferase, partial [Spirochaetes bacterium]|nr:nicotinate-nucleotide--dimethylbenzimidazole phosphoribosyltransferase [Spirochaetota bacterium]